MESLFTQLLVIREVLTRNTTKHINIILRQLKRRRLEAHTTRRVTQHEPEIDMNDMALVIDEYIPIMSVFELQDIGDDAVGREGALECVDGDFVGIAFWDAECFNEMVLQGCDSATRILSGFDGG